MERAFLMRPNNYVVMMARVRGAFSPDQVRHALRRARVKYPLLGSRIKLGPGTRAVFTNTTVPPIPVKVIPRESPEHWLQVAETSHREFFEIERGPLARVHLLRAPSTANDDPTPITDVVLTCHHAICDGLSLVRLVESLLHLMAHPAFWPDPRPVPPPITPATLPERPAGWLTRQAIRILNALWRRRAPTFGGADLHRLHARYWKDHQCQLAAWACDETFTRALVSRCRAEAVTVHTALCVAFLRAQHELAPTPGPAENFHMPVNMRERLARPGAFPDLTGAFGCYAGTIVFRSPVSPDRGFWDDCRQFHARVREIFGDRKVFQLYRLLLVAPSLFDALYFQKMGFLDDGVARKLLEATGLDHLVASLAVTNLGRLATPARHGPLTLEGLYGPSVYTDVLGKVVSALTIDGRLHFTLTADRANASRETLEATREVTMRVLETAVREAK